MAHSVRRPTLNLSVTSSSSMLGSILGIKATLKKENSTNRIYASLKARGNPLLKLKTYAKRIILREFRTLFFNKEPDITDCSSYGFIHSHPTLLLQCKSSHKQCMNECILVVLYL